MSLEDLLIGGAAGYTLSSLSNNSSTTIRNIQHGREDQISLLINLPIDDVGKKVISALEHGTNVDNRYNTRRCLIKYDEKEKVFKYKNVELKYRAYEYARLTKIDENKTILLIKIYDSDGDRIFDEDEIILIYNKLKEYIDIRGI